MILNPSCIGLPLFCCYLLSPVIYRKFTANEARRQESFSRFCFFLAVRVVVVLLLLAEEFSMMAGFH